MTSTNTYVLSGGTDEEQRLQAQSASFDPLTRRLFADAGLASGMRVLDLGCGAGNVSRLAAEIVGPEGSVLGVDRDPAAVERSQRLAGGPHVQFQQADVNHLADEVAGDFDAVVGRIVLWIAAAFFALTPIWGGYAQFISKDTLYTACMLLFVLAVLRVAVSPHPTRFAGHLPRREASLDAKLVL